MNCFFSSSAISVTRRMVGGVIGSRRRLNFPSLDRVLKLRAAAAVADEVSVTRCRAVSSDMLAGVKQRRMMSTASGDYENGPKEAVKAMADDDVEAKKLRYDSYCNFLEELAESPKLRSDREIKDIYKMWCIYNPRILRKFRVFKEHMRVVDQFNTLFPNGKLRLNDDIAVKMMEKMIKEDEIMYPKRKQKHKEQVKEMEQVKDMEQVKEVIISGEC